MIDTTPDSASAQGVLVVNHSSKLAGAELILLDLVKGFGPGSSAFLFEDGPLLNALTDSGFAVTVSRGRGSFKHIKRDKSLIRALPQIVGLGGVAREIIGHARHHRVLYANSQKAFVLAAITACIVRRPLVWHLHDILSAQHFGAAQRRLVVTISNWTCARVIVPSAAAAEAFIRAGGNATRLTVVPNGLDVEAEPLGRAALRAAMGLPDGFLFGVFSRLAPWKGQHVALEAAASLPGCYCLIAGSALFGEQAYAASLRETADRLGIADRVIFAGQRDDVPRLMRAMDAVVHPSVEPEPFGRTLVEAMLCRVPVIAAHNGAAAEILDDGRAGRLVPPNNAKAVVAALRSLMDQPDAISENLDHAEQRARLLYNRTRMVAGVQAVLASISSAATPAYQPDTRMHYPANTPVSARPSRTSWPSPR